MTVPTRYHAEPAPNLLIRSLDDITLIHHRRSGQTHIVVSPVPEILAAMNEMPQDAAAILATLTAQFDLGDPADANPAIEAHLVEMAALGLVHRT